MESLLLFGYGILKRLKDQEWLDAVNLERKHDQLDKVSYETFEIVMDRLEKEWFELVCPHISLHQSLD